MNTRSRHTIVMATSSYPRFQGDGVGSFIEPIAHGIAALGHEVHIVAPWHPLIRRPIEENGVHFHFFRYFPSKNLNIFGYASSLTADVALRPATYLITPFALVSWWNKVRQVAKRHHASLIHAHWVIPGGFVSAATHLPIPMIVSLHGSDVFVAESYALARMAAGYTFSNAAWVTACSDDLRQRAITIGADAQRSETIPYGVDADRFKPNALTRAKMRQLHNINDQTPLIVAAGRLVRKKGFEFLIDALGTLKTRYPQVRLWLVGGGDLENELRQRTKSKGLNAHVKFFGALPQHELASILCTADITVVPSVRDDAGNVDGLPNILLEALSSGSTVVATPAGGITTVAKDGETACIVPERDPNKLSETIEKLLTNVDLRTELGSAARTLMLHNYTWQHVAKRFEKAYQNTITHHADT